MIFNESALRIGYGVHGVIIDYGQAKSELAKRLFELDISPGMFASRVVVREKNIMSPESFYLLLNEIYHGGENALRIPLVPGAENCIASLAIAGVNQFIVSSNYANSLELTFEILAKHGLLNFLTGAFIFDYGKVDKKYANRMNFDYFIDDNPIKLQELFTVKAVKHPYLLDQEHNRDVDCRSYAERISSIQDFYKIISKNKRA